MTTSNVYYDILKWTVILLCLLVPILWRQNSAFRFHMKTLAVGACMVIVSFPFAFCSLWRPKDVRNYKFGQWLLPNFTAFLNIKWELKGKEKLDKLIGPCVFVCNHQSFLDMIGMMCLWPERCVPMVKKELMYYGVFGLVGYLTGSVFVDRSKKQNFSQVSTNIIQYMKEKTVRLWIFPEGTRSHDGEMLPFKKGAFHIAIQGQFPILPIVFSSYASFYSRKEKKFLSDGLLIMEVLDMICTEGMDIGKLDELAMKTRSVMMEGYKRISEEAAEKYDARDF